jgi:hypothetical protein
VTKTELWGIRIVLIEILENELLEGQEPSDRIKGEDYEIGNEMDR